MASDERRQEDQKLQEMNIFNAQGAAPKNATTNEFMCGKCKQRKVSYYQMQTRSADEPMTSMRPLPNPQYMLSRDRD
jgi:transcription elongation factor S-II